MGLFRTFGPLLLLAACSGKEGGVPTGSFVAPATKPEVVLAAAPPMTDGQFPCTDCHDPTLPVRTERHALATAHQEIEMRHGGERMWCFDCHDVKDRDKLRTASGELLAFTDVQLLCGQCHGHQLRDWEAGAHGRRSGSFTGTAKRRFLSSFGASPEMP